MGAAYPIAVLHHAMRMDECPQCCGLWQVSSEGSVPGGARLVPRWIASFVAFMVTTSPAATLI